MGWGLITQKAKAWLSGAGGATAIEYALIAAGVSLALLVFIFGFGQDIGDLFLSFASAIDI